LIAFIPGVTYLVSDSKCRDILSQSSYYNRNVNKINMNTQKLFDNQLAKLKMGRARKLNAKGADFLAEHAAVDLHERLLPVERNFPVSAALFCATGAAARVLRESGKTDKIIRIEDCRVPGGRNEALVISDIEEIPLARESANLVVSLLAMHRINDLPGFLTQIRNSLKPDGLFLAAVPGAGTLAELRECLLAADAEINGGAVPRVMPLADVRQLGGLLQRAGFALPVADIENLTVRYGTMFDLIRDLRAMGSTNILLERSRRFENRFLFLRAAEIYRERYSDADGRIRATFSLVWLSGWAPHESQQKPARRGSATQSLEAALNNLKPR
jgi:SAM-dependent methyltransferase